MLLAVTENRYNVTSHGSDNGSPAKQKSGFDVCVVLAFADIYILWGSTYLAIRVAVQLVPPLFAAGIRFFLAGTMLYAVMRFYRRPTPTSKQEGNLAVLGVLIV